MTEMMTGGLAGFLTACFVFLIVLALMATADRNRMKKLKLTTQKQNLVYDMTEARQQSKSNPELMHTKKAAP